MTHTKKDNSLTNLPHETETEQPNKRKNSSYISIRYHSTHRGVILEINQEEN